MNVWGNRAILDLHKTGFLCSRRCPAMVVLRSYEWAKAQRVAGECIVCGDHSSIEKDVFKILLKGNQPLILVLARGMKVQWEEKIKKAIAANRLLIVSPFDESVKRVTRETARVRNQKIIDMTDELVVGYVSEGGQLAELLEDEKYADFDSPQPGKSK